MVTRVTEEAENTHTHTHTHTHTQAHTHTLHDCVPCLKSGGIALSTEANVCRKQNVLKSREH
jgi:hypothetical protein